MDDLPFHVELNWSGVGRAGAGRIITDDLELDISTPTSMGGRGAGTSPEELLVCALASCHAATLFGVLHRGGLPGSSVSVDARGSVCRYPGQTRFERIVVSPTIVDGDSARISEYEGAARTARDRCFIGRTIAGNVDYQVGRVTVAPRQAVA